MQGILWQQCPQVVNVDSRAPRSVHGQVKRAHTDFTKKTGMATRKPERAHNTREIHTPKRIDDSNTQHCSVSASNRGQAKTKANCTQSTPTTNSTTIGTRRRGLTICPSKFGDDADHQHYHDQQGAYDVDLCCASTRTERRQNCNARDCQCKQTKEAAKRVSVDVPMVP